MMEMTTYASLRRAVPEDLGCRLMARLTGVLDRTRGRVSRVKMIGSSLVAQGKIKYLLPRSRKTALSSNLAKFTGQLTVVRAVQQLGEMSLSLIELFAEFGE